MALRGAPKPKALKRDYLSSRNGRIEEEEGVVLARAIVTRRDCAEDHVPRQPVSGAAPDYMSFRTVAS